MLGVVQRASVIAISFVAVFAGACVTRTSTAESPPTAHPDARGGGVGSDAASEPDGDPERWLAEAEASLARDQPAKAATLFARYLGRASGPGLAQAYRGLARAHEQLGDFEAAIRAYD